MARIIYPNHDFVIRLRQERASRLAPRFPRSQLNEGGKIIALHPISRPAPSQATSRWKSALAKLIAGLLSASAGLVYGQDSLFTFDPNGNLLSQLTANLALPQIVAQPQPQLVQPGELASF